jgi:RHS repeat-associated protein
MLATINGTGAEAEIYTDLTDHLSGASVVLNSNNEVVETTDYYSFGKIRTDNKVEGYTEQRKYIGQEYDEDTGLNYLNARYYNSAIARFVTQDPVALATPEQFLQDPQQFNFYSYARNNPLAYIDRDGKSAELVIVPIPWTVFGAHTFVRITADQPGEDLSQYGSGPNYTIGGYPKDGKLQAQINESGNLNAPESSYLVSYPLDLPKGMSIAQYDQKLLEEGYKLSKSDLGIYVFTGQPISNFPNSGNTSAQVIINAGGTVPTLQNVYYGPAGYLGIQTPYFPLGAGKPIGTPSYGQQLNTTARNYIDNKAQSTLNSISSTLSRLTQALAKANSNMIIK